MTDMFEREFLLQVGDSYKKAQKAIEVIDKLLIELQKAVDESPDFAEDNNTDNTEGISAGRAIELLRKMKNTLMEAVRENENFLNDYRSVVFPSRSVSVSDPTARMSMPDEFDADSTRICVDTVKALVEKTETIACDTYPAVISEELCEALNEYNASVNVLSQKSQRFRGSIPVLIAVDSSGSIGPMSPTHNLPRDLATMPPLSAGVSCHAPKAPYDMELEMRMSMSDSPVRKPRPKRESRLKSWFASRKKAKVKHPEMDSVRFSAVSPAKITAGEYLPVNIVMYEDAHRSAVERIISSFGSDAKESESGYQDVCRNSMIKIILSSDDVHIDDDTEEQEWNGKYLNFNFNVKVPDDKAEGQISLKACVYINDLPATKLTLLVACNSKPGENITILRKDILSAFISYASQDRATVATFVQAMETVRRDMKIFFDVDSLRSGQHWGDELIKEIDNSDVLFLCWSQNAKESEWVDKEWRYALETKGDEAIEPMPIVPAEKCPPPPELQHKHFNNRLLYIIEATKN